MRRFGVWLALVLLIPYLQFVGGGWQGIYDSTIRLTSLVLIAGVFAGWALVAVCSPDWRPRSALMVPIILVLGSMALSAVASRQPRISAEYLAYAVLLAGLYLLLVRLLGNSFLSRRIVTLSVMLLIVIAGAYLAGVAGRWLEWWALVGNVTFPPLRPAFESFLYGNPSSVMAVVVLLYGSALASIGPASGRRALLLALITFLSANVIVTSGSRAGWLGAAVAVAVVTAAVLARPTTRKSIRAGAEAMASGRMGRSLIAGAILLVVVALAIFGPAIMGRVLAPGGEVRGGFTIAALRMFAEAPILGTGPGSWVAQRVQYTYPPEIDYYIPHAHNMYAQVLAEMGLVGALAGVVLAIWLLRLIGGAIRGEDPVRRRWGYVALGTSVYFAAHSTLDVFTNMPAILFPLAIPIAWLDATHARQPAPVSLRVPRAGFKLGGAAACAAVVISLVALFTLEFPALASQRAAKLANTGNWDEARLPAIDAVNADPGMPAFQYTLGLVLDRAGDSTGAAAAFRQVAERDDLPEAWLNLAAEEARLRHPDAALEALRSALRLGYQRPAVAMAAGQLALELDDTRLAIFAFASAIIATPSLAADDFWMEDHRRSAILPAILEMATDREDPTRSWRFH